VTEPLHTSDDDAFMKQEIQAVLEKFDPHKAPGKDTLNSEVLLYTLRSFTTFFTEIYSMERKSTDGMPTRILLWPRILECVVQRPFKPRIFQLHQNNNLRRRFCNP